jgi:transposase-like protein
MNNRSANTFHNLFKLVEEKQSGEAALRKAKANVQSLRKEREKCAAPLKAIEEKFQELQKVQKSGSLIENFVSCTFWQDNCRSR